MAGRGKWAIFLLLALLAPARSQEQVDVTGLEAWLAGVRPEVEKVLGYALHRLPGIASCPDAIQQADGPEIALHFRYRFPHLRDQALRDASVDALRVHQQAAVARLKEDNSVIMVFPTHPAKIAKWTESPPAGAPSSQPWHNAMKSALSPDFVRLAVLHELVRYALDTRYNLGKMRDSCRDANEWFAVQAVIEGRAQWVTRHIAKQRHVEEIFPLLAGRYLYVPDVSPDPGLRTVSQSVVRQKFWAYEQGLAFWTFLDSQGKAEEKAVFAHPPRQAKWIEHPDSYLRGVPSQRPDLDAVLATLEPQLPGTVWASTRQPWTPDMCIQVAGLLKEKDRAEKVVQGWEEGRSMIWSWKNSPELQVALSVVRYETPAGARGYFGFALDLQRKRDQLSNQPCGLPLKVIESHVHDISLNGVDEAVLFEKKMQSVNSRRTLSSHILLVRQGDRVVELTWYGLPADTAWAQRILDALPR